MPAWSYIIIAVAAYLLGSIPTGFLVAKARGVDIRTVGSGNIGATNAMRVLGKPAGIFVLLVDAAKGYVACALIPPLIWNWIDALQLHFTMGMVRPFQEEPIENQIQYHLLAGVFAVLGHNFTCWLKFKGGKGIATSAGVFFALAPLAAGIALGAWILVFALSRYVSVASIAAAVVLPVAVWLTKDDLTLRLVTTALGLLAIAKHKENIKRLLNGTERRFDKKPSTEAAK